MGQSKRAWFLAMALGLVGRAQPPLSPLASEVVLSTRFVTPLTYEAALARLASYYDDQVGRQLPVAFPEIAPRCHFEVWHDMWVFFGAAAGQTTVTLKRPTAGIASLLVKSWMLDLAGRLDAAMPVEFREEPPLHEVEGDIEASRSDLARALGTTTSMRAIPDRIGPAAWTPPCQSSSGKNHRCMRWRATSRHRAATWRGRWGPRRR